MIWFARGLFLILVFLVWHMPASADDVRADIAPVSEISETPQDVWAEEAGNLLASCILNAACPEADIPDRAGALAQKALSIEPRHTEARLQLAIALSMQARDMPLGEARKGKYAERMRALAEAVLVDDPGNPWAHGFMAVWHLEVRQRGGMFGAAIMGASVSEAKTHFDAMESSAPEDMILHWQYARALTALNARRHDAEIRGVLEKILSRNANEPLELCAMERARDMLSIMSRKAFAEAEMLSRRLM